MSQQINVNELAIRVGLEPADRYTAAETAKILGVSKQIIYRMVRNGTLPMFRLTRLTGFVTAETIEQYLRESLTGNAAA